MSGQALFQVRGVSKRFRLPRTSLFRRPGLVTAVDDVSFELGEGETLGVVGESGSGKTTLVRLMLGLEQPDQGQIVYAGGEGGLWRSTTGGEQGSWVAIGNPEMSVSSTNIRPSSGRTSPTIM